MNVSVIIPAYNVENRLRRAVESALMQAEVAEVIIVEDCSTDGTLAVCDEIAGDDERIIIIKNSVNRGAATARNIGIKKSSCEYIAFLDADDYYYLDRFTGQLEYLADNKECDGVYGSVSVEVENTAEKDWENAQIVGGPEFTSKGNLLISLSKGECWHINGFMIRKCALNNTSGLNAKLRLGQDLEWFIRLSVTCNLAKYDSAPVACYARHPGNRSGANRHIHMIGILDSASKWFAANHYQSESLIVREQLRNRMFEAMQVIKSKHGFASCSRYAIRAASKLPSVLVSRLFWERLLK